MYAVSDDRFMDRDDADRIDPDGTDSGHVDVARPNAASRGGEEDAERRVPLADPLESLTRRFIECLAGDHVPGADGTPGHTNDRSFGLVRAMTNLQILTDAVRREEEKRLRFAGTQS